MKFSIKDLFSKCDQIRRKLRIWSHLLKKSLWENFIFCVVPQLKEYAQVLVIFIKKTCGRAHACNQVTTTIQILGISRLTNKTVKTLLPLNIISFMCKKRSKSARKYLQTGYTTYRPGLSSWQMLLIYILFHPWIWFAECKWF